ncbi:hypothetical protein B0J11DRAFT_483240 [Dendryphion nanum]|uniref:Uncharacterized protein n=1 Tax=Dendryphion nanum TaxID=256645 RepID=A0A9P9E4H1_9PLEO|nr:hypothetical protein B0J11DRAFT_483240 [Dendryphion nanum]
MWLHSAPLSKDIHSTLALIRPYLGTIVIVKPLLAIAKLVVLQSWLRKHQTCIVRTVPDHVFK